jgi:hypothetical protein
VEERRVEKKERGNQLARATPKNWIRTCPISRVVGDNAHDSPPARRDEEGVASVK